MKYLVISDIHGYDEYIEYIDKLIEESNPDKVILLGDIMAAYRSPEKLIALLTKYQDKLVIIKGNCDYPLTIPLEMKDFYEELINGKVFMFTHGHLLNFLPTDDVDVLVSGHTHENLLVQAKSGKILFNPGSIASPRGNTVNSYGIITDEELILKNLEGEDIKRLKYTN